MSDAISGIQSPNPIKGEEVAPQPPPPQKSGSSSSKSFDGTLEGLKEVNEELYDAMMEGIAQTICQEAKKHNDKQKKMNQEARRFLNNG